MKPNKAAVSGRALPPLAIHVDHYDYLALPSHLSSFLSSAYFLDDTKWEAVFSNRIFEAKRDDKDNSTLHIASPHRPPVANIFYCLQLLAPGMLLIVDSEVTDDEGKRMYCVAFHPQNGSKTIVQNEST